MEMMVVIGIIAVILSVVLLIGVGAINDAKTRDTEVMLNMLNTAFAAFAADAPYKSIPEVKDRYGLFPPDALMAYDPSSGDPDILTLNLMPGGIGRFVMLDGGTPVSPIHDDYNPGNANQDQYVPQGAVKALVWALRSRSSSSAIYDGISDRFKRTVGEPGVPPTEFFDINGNGSYEPLTDKEVQYIVDGWGNPIEYYSTRERLSDPSSHEWVASKLVPANKNLPVLVSYGLDGDLQIEQGRTLEWAYNDNNVSSGDLMFASPLHQDNVYLDDTIKGRMAGITKD